MTGIARRGLDIAGSTEGPLVTLDRPRQAAFDDLVARARAGDGTIDASACPYPVHELPTYLVLEQGLLLHGSNDRALDATPEQFRRIFPHLRAAKRAREATASG